MIFMVYSDDDDFAEDENFDDWDAYALAKGFPTKKTLNRWRKKANERINEWIGSYGTDVTDSRFVEYLKDLELELIQRRKDKMRDRKSKDGSMKVWTMPHDYLYEYERKKLMKIGVMTGFRKVGGVTT